MAWILLLEVRENTVHKWFNLKTKIKSNSKTSKKSIMYSKNAVENFDFGDFCSIKYDR